jgi:hypothetical protein
MANITVKDLDRSTRNLSESELALQGGKKRKSNPPVVAPVPDILIGFAPYSIF